jgi:general stress protein YciG
MPGTRHGGRKAAATNKMRYGANFYESIGKLGGQKSRGGGFAKNPDLAREAGRRGGMASRRRKASTNAA